MATRPFSALLSSLDVSLENFESSMLEIFTYSINLDMWKECREIGKACYAELSRESSKSILEFSYHYGSVGVMTLKHLPFQTVVTLFEMCHILNLSVVLR